MLIFNLFVLILFFGINRTDYLGQQANGGLVTTSISSLCRMAQVSEGICSYLMLNSLDYLGFLMLLMSNMLSEMLLCVIDFLWLWQSLYAYAVWCHLKLFKLELETLSLKRMPVIWWAAAGNFAPGFLGFTDFIYSNDVGNLWTRNSKLSITSNRYLQE